MKNGKISEIIIDPKKINVDAENFSNILGGDTKFNAKKIIDIFKGEDNDFSKAVCLNASAGLVVSENQENIMDAYSITRKHILSGKSYEHLKKIQLNE